MVLAGAVRRAHRGPAAGVPFHLARAGLDLCFIPPETVLAGPSRCRGRTLGPPPGSTMCRREPDIGARAGPAASVFCRSRAVPVPWTCVKLSGHRTILRAGCRPRSPGGRPRRVRGGNCFQTKTRIFLPAWPARPFVQAGPCLRVPSEAAEAGSAGLVRDPFLPCRGCRPVLAILQRVAGRLRPIAASTPLLGGAAHPFCQAGTMRPDRASPQSDAILAAGQWYTWWPNCKTLRG